MKKTKAICSLALTVVLITTMLLSTNLTVSAEATKKKVDLVFVIDSTGSMRSYIEPVKKNLTSFVNEIESKKIELKMAVVEYRDITEDGDNSTIVHDFSGSKWTDDVSAVINVFDNIHVDGGGDEPETPTDAFQQILNEWDTEDSEKFVFLLTDADYKELDSTDSDGDGIPDHYGMELCTQTMREKDIKTSVVSNNSFEPRYNYLYTMTGGIFIDINSKDYYKLMQEFSNYIYETVIDGDGDGIPDEWEINGVDYNDDGVIDVDLRAMGADPKVPDIFVEVDYMYKAPDKFLFWDVGEKKCTLSENAYKKVYDSFKSQGIKIHIDAGSDSIMNFETNAKWGGLSRSNSFAYEETFDLGDSFSNWNNLAINNFDKSRWTTFHYCSLVNQYNLDGNKNSSGIAENIGGQFFMVATGHINNGDTGQAGTFMHELGHTLGLSHGGLHFDNGVLTRDHANYKPNHISVMNYTYQFPGIKTVLGDSLSNYQGFALPALNENLLNESSGIDPSNVTYGMGLFINYNKKDVESWDSIDFNKNGKIDTGTVICDVNPADSYYTNPLLHETLNEWKNLTFNGNLIGGHGEDFNIDAITTLITSHEDMDYHELSIEEALQNNVLGREYECRVSADNVNKLYSGIKDQKLRIPVENLYNAKTTVKLDISSDVLDEKVSLETEIEASEKEITQKVVETKVKDNLISGTYDIEYVLTLENGESVHQSGKIEVSDTEIKTVEVGYSEKLPNIEKITWSSSDEKILRIDSESYIAESSGTAYIYGTSQNENYAFIVNVNDKEQETTEPTTIPTTAVPSTDATSGADSPKGNQNNNNQSSNTSYNNNSEAVQTGDSNIALFAFVAMISCLAVSSVVYFIRKQKK